MGYIIGLLIRAMIGFAIGAVIFRATVSLLNRIVKEPVDVPGFGRFLHIFFVRYMAVVGIWIVILLVGAILSGGKPEPATQLGLNVFVAILGLLVSAGIISAMLPTSYRKGLLISFLDFAITLCLLFVLSFVLFLLALAGGGLGV